MPNSKDYEYDVPEEDISEYKEGGFHPVHIGDRFNNERYEILNKIGHGSFSTVWAARDHQDERIVCIKILTAEVSEIGHELHILQRIQSDEITVHPGRKFLPKLLDHFYHDGINGHHAFLVLELLGPSLSDVCEHLSGSRLVIPHARRISRQILLATDYLHSLGFAHGDIYSKNILFRLPDGFSSPLDLSQVKKNVIRRARKKDKRPIETGLPAYFVQPAKFHKEVYKDLIDVQIIDFSSVFPINNPLKELITPKHQHPPEFIFRKALSEAVDIWAIANLVMFIVTKSSMFDTLMDTRVLVPKFHKVIGGTSAHWLLTAMNEALESGSWPDFPNLKYWTSSNDDILEKQVPKYFFSDGTRYSDEDQLRITQDLEVLSQFLRKTFVVDPVKRATAKELLEDEWVRVEHDDAFDKGDYPQGVLKPRPTMAEMAQRAQEMLRADAEKDKKREIEAKKWKVGGDDGEKKKEEESDETEGEDYDDSEEDSEQDSAEDSDEESGNSSDENSEGKYGVKSEEESERGDKNE